MLLQPFRSMCYRWAYRQRATHQLKYHGEGHKISGCYPPFNCLLPLSGVCRCHLNSPCADWDTMMPLSRHTWCNLPTSSSFPETFPPPSLLANFTLSPPTSPRWNLACRPWNWYYRGLFLVPSCKTLQPSPTLHPGPTRGPALLSFHHRCKKSGSSPKPPIPSCIGTPGFRIPHKEPHVPPHLPLFWKSWGPR